MKIILTKDEAKRHILQHLKILGAGYLPVDTEIEITDGSSEIDWKDKLTPELRDLINWIEKMDYTRSDKIRAIKLAREKTNCSLAEGKWAVENWLAVKGFMSAYLRWPNIDRDHNGQILLH